MGYNMVVADSEYEDGINFVTQQCNLAENLIENYCSCLEIIINDAVKSGDTNLALKEFCSKVQKLKGKNIELYRKYKEINDEYIREIDANDGILYYPGDVRRYEDKEMQALSKLFKQTLDIRINRNLEHGLSGLLSIGISIFKNHVNYLKEKLGFYNEKKLKLVKQIFDNVHQVDLKYCRRMNDDLKGKSSYPGMDVIGCTLMSEIAVIKAFTNILNGDMGQFTVENITMTVDPLFDKLLNSLEDLSNVVDSDDFIAIEDIKEFAKYDANQQWFKEFQEVCKVEFNSRDWSDEVINMIHNLKDVLVSEMGIRIPEEISDNNSKIQDYIRIKKNMLEMLDDEASINKMLKQYKSTNVVKGNDFFNKLYNTASSEMKDYESVYKEISSYYGDILKSIGYVGKVEDIITPIFADYVETIEKLKQLQRNCKEGSVEELVIRDLINEYEHPVLKSGTAVREELADFAVDKSVDELVVAIIGKEKLGVLKATRTAYNFITNDSSRYSSIVDFKSCYKINNELIKNYKECFSIVQQSGDNASEEQLNQLKYSFDMLKQNYVKEFNNLATYYKGTEQEDKAVYYQYLSTKLGAMKMTDVTSWMNAYGNLDF